MIVLKEQKDIFFELIVINSMVHNSMIINDLTCTVITEEDHIINVDTTSKYTRDIILKMFLPFRYLIWLNLKF